MWLGVQFDWADDEMLARWWRDELCGDWYRRQCTRLQTSGPTEYNTQHTLTSGIPNFCQSKAKRKK